MQGAELLCTRVGSVARKDLYHIYFGTSQRGFCFPTPTIWGAVRIPPPIGLLLIHTKLIHYTDSEVCNPNLCGKKLKIINNSHALHNHKIPIFELGFLINFQSKAP